jgi:hypothetical protein
MISCQYVGSDCAIIGEREFDTVGQLADFSEQEYRDVVLGNAHFIRNEDFKKCGFTEEELTSYGQSGSRVDPTPEFMSKLDMAQKIFCDAHARMLVDEGSVLSEASDEDLIVQA